MNASFLAMGLGVFFSSAFVTAALIAFVIGPVARAATRLSLSARRVLWMLLATAPAAAGTTALMIALLPSFGLAADHCLVHAAHHPHLCLHHPQELSVPAGLIAIIGLTRVATSVIAEVHNWVRARRMSRSLASMARINGPFTIFPGRTPTAFVLGSLRPRIFVSEAMMQLPNSVLEPALAHERCHATKRHLLTRLVARVFGILHVPLVARQLIERLAAAQELEADAAARSETGDGIQVAESLLRLARARQGAPAGAIGFADGALHERVSALLDPDKTKTTWPVALLVLAATTAVVLAFHAPEAVHHTFETVLGWLH